MFEQLTVRLNALTVPDRTVDALVMLYLLGHKPSRNPRIWVLKDNQTQPLCLLTESPPEKLLSRLSYDGHEVIYFEYEGGWFHFVTRTVPPLTASVDEVVRVIARVYPEYDQWMVGSNGEATIWGEPPTILRRAKNTIPAVAMISAILIHKFEQERYDTRNCEVSWIQS